jgi:hypothetical protein
MRHSKYDYILKVVGSGIAVLLTSEAGAGKTTIAKQIADELKLTFYTMSMTKQSSVNSIIGFTSINGKYIGTQFREAFEFGGLMLIDEIDACDPNVMLVLNTIENGYVAFPDGIVNVHKDFKLVATANPFNDHATYTGRSKLDFSIIDRYFVIQLERDNKLEKQLVCEDTHNKITVARKVLKSNGSSIPCTMRDAIRIHKLNQLDISKDPVKDVLFHTDDTFHNEYEVAYLRKYPIYVEPVADISSGSVPISSSTFDEVIPNSFEEYWNITKEGENDE